MSANGDPLNRQTWSGTPWHLARALERAGITVCGIDDGPSLPGKVLLRALTRAAGYGRDWRRAPLAHMCATRATERRLRNANVDTILHMGTGDVPLRQLSMARHFLFQDTTWHQWVENAPDIHSYPRRAIVRGDELERRALHQVEHVFTVSENARLDVIDHYGVAEENVTTVHTGRGQVRAFEGQKDYAAGHVLWVGRQRVADKGLHLLLDAFRRYRELREIELVIVGPAQLGPLVADLPHATVTGFVGEDALQALFDHARLFAMPALNEPWGLVYLEALATRTPILGLRRHAFPEISGNGRFGIIVEEADADAVGKALVEALADPERLDRLGADGQEHCLATYTWDRVAAAIAPIVADRTPAREEPRGG